MTAIFEFAPRGSTDEIETGLVFMPRFDAAGLIPAIATDAGSGEVLLFAYMNDEALRLTLSTGEAHFYSRSRQGLWRKGETSGNVMQVTEIRTDCDQDAIWLRVKVSGGGAACHLGERSCFSRVVTKKGGALFQKREPD